jgi:hypothetical protein
MMAPNGKIFILVPVKRLILEHRSTYTAEMVAMKTAAEEAINIRYVIRALGVPIKHRTALWGDNMGSLINTDYPGSQCAKKHSQVAFHYVRECNTAGIIEIFKVETAHNLYDPVTKALPGPHFLYLCQCIYKKVDHNVAGINQGDKTSRRRKSSQKGDLAKC